MSGIRIATRGSDLALAQTRKIVQRLKDSGFEAAEKIMTTRGDVDARPFSYIQGDGFFTKELERAMLSDEAQMAVHSSKDLPSMIHTDLPWMAVGPREETCDILVIRSSCVESVGGTKVPKVGTRLGTSSPRRMAQLTRNFPHAVCEQLRGNVPTRVGKVLNGSLDGVFLAKAGWNRLGGVDRLLAGASGVEVIELDWVTAPCQGIVGVQSRADYSKFLHHLADVELDRLAKAEKTLLAMLGGGCHLPIGAKISKTVSGGYRLDFFHQDEHTKNYLEFHTEAETLGGLLREAFARITYAPVGSRRIWITNPLQHMLKPAGELSRKGFTAVPWPLIEIRPTWKWRDVASLDQKWDNYGAVALSSVFASQIFLKEMILTEAAEKQLRRIPIFCVGPATAEPLKERGFEVRSVPQEATAVALARMISEMAEADKDDLEIGRLKKVLLPGTPDSLVLDELVELKVPVDLLELYSARPSENPLTLEMAEPKRGDAIIFTSPSAVREFAGKLRTHPKLGALSVFAFGPSTSKALDEASIFHKTNPKSGSWDAMIDLISETLGEVTR